MRVDCKILEVEKTEAVDEKRRGPLTILVGDPLQQKCYENLREI